VRATRRPGPRCPGAAGAAQPRYGYRRERKRNRHRGRSTMTYFHDLPATPIRASTPERVSGWPSARKSWNVTAAPIWGGVPARPRAPRSILDSRQTVGGLAVHNASNARVFEILWWKTAPSDTRLSPRPPEGQAWQPVSTVRRRRCSHGVPSAEEKYAQAPPGSGVLLDL